MPEPSWETLKWFTAETQAWRSAMTTAISLALSARS